MALSSETDVRVAGASSDCVGLLIVFCWHAATTTLPATRSVRAKNRMGSSRLRGSPRGKARGVPGRNVLIVGHLRLPSGGGCHLQRTEAATARKTVAGN